jgi:hypothetical protein
MADLIYNESLCEEARQILARGKSIARLATDLGVCRDTIYDWIEKHPEFAKAIRRGKDACQAYWEDRGEAGTFGEIDKFTATSWIFTMKNRFRTDYQEDKSENKSVSDSIVEKLIDRLVE